MVRAYIGFGANLANPRATLLDAIAALALRGIVIADVSPLYRSPAWPPGSDAPDYLNAVLAVDTAMGAEGLMSLLLDIEAELGRVRSTRNAPRRIDLDLVDYASDIRSSERLDLPHPRMQDRAFVLLPLRDVSPDWQHPEGWCVEDRLKQIDTSETSRVTGLHSAAAKR